MFTRLGWFKKAKFVYPIRPAPRCAVLSAAFRPSVINNTGCAVRVFPEWNVEAQAFAPEAIAATLPQLEALAGVRLTHAVIVFRREWEPRLTPEERDRLWWTFRVPVFEQILAEDGELLASECEAHAGLHVQSAKLACGDHEIDRAPCPCGLTTPRLIAATPAETLRRVAAYAR